MPIFDNKFTFIHIPKSGGTSIESFLESNGCHVSLLRKNGTILINGHTPQHCTFRELQELGLLTEEVFAIKRNEIDRTVSEYFWCKKNRQDINYLFDTFDEFLELFLNKDNYQLFDYHNLSNKEFLINSDGIIDSSIKIFDFFDYKKIEQYLGFPGLKHYHENQTQSEKFFLEDYQIEKIKKFYDIE